LILAKKPLLKGGQVTSLGSADKFGETSGGGDLGPKIRRKGGKRGELPGNRGERWSLYRRKGGDFPNGGGEL